MPQSRLYLAAYKVEADRIFELLDRMFEDEGLAIANLETDEASQTCEISVYVDQDTHDPSELADLIRDRLGADGFGTTVEIETLPDIDWVAKSLEGLKPVRAGRFLVHGGHDRAARKANDIAIEIEAGQAFGTGHHGTTAGCLEMIERLAQSRRPANALDLGTGSGVLAIALAKRARIPVLATDIDPVATRVARGNAKLNGVAGLVRLETATGFTNRAFLEEGPFDLVVANILAKPLMRMAPAIERNLARGGDVVVSGILVYQRNMVLAAFRNAGLYHRETLTRGEWVTIHLARR